MASFTGHYDETHTVRAAPETVRATFLDLDTIAEQFGDLESVERVDDQTLSFLMEAQNHGVFTFQGRYTCRYQPDGDRGVRWASEGEGNVVTQGHLTVSDGPSPGTTTLHYVAEMTLEIDVQAMLAPVLKPVVEMSIPQQMGAYVKRMIKAAEARA